MQALSRKTVGSLPLALGRGFVGSKLVGYGLAALGPISVSATHFLLSFAMLHFLTPGDFGRFTFLLVAAQLGWGVWSALFCAPMPIFMTRGPRAEWEAGRDMLLRANLAGVVLAGPLLAAIASALGAPQTVVLCYAGFCALSLIRWFGRGYAYFEGRQVLAVASDLLYSCAALASAALLLLLAGVRPELACFAGLLVGGLTGLLPFARMFSLSLAATPSLGFIRSYVQVWRDQSRWALLGVVTTEATANAHVYLVTLVLGPAAFAPIAAASLLLRPLNVVQLALADFERPRLARLVSTGDMPEIERSLRQFQLALTLVWVVTALGATMVFHYGAGVIFPAEYDVRTLLIATALWMLVAAARSVQVPPATILGVVGEFRKLAFASIWSSLVSTASVGIIVLLLDPVWSIGGLLVGALVFAALTFGIHWQWRADFAGTRPAAAVEGS